MTIDRRMTLGIRMTGNVKITIIVRNIFIAKIRKAFLKLCQMF
jgi:hypothetical protein